MHCVLYVRVAARVPLVDYHVHTARCGHARGAIERYVERAIESGLTELGFSDHLYLYWVPPQQRDPELAMADWELEFYIEDVERCRARYRDDIVIRLSVEADFVPGHERQLEGILGRYDWDYVIGSVHFLDGWGFDDERYISGYATWDIDTLYGHYFDVVGASAETGLFDTIGHPDLVKKFGHRPHRDLSAEYAALAERFARAGVCVEVNTAGLRKPVGEIYPNADLLRACHSAGVTATLGADAHSPHEVASDLTSAVTLLRDSGYHEYVRFARRTRANTLLPLNDQTPLPGRGVGAASSALDVPTELLP